MAIDISNTSFPLDSVQTGLDASGFPLFDRVYHSNTLRKVVQGIVTDGVAYKSNSLSFEVTPLSGFNVSVAPGSAVVGGLFATMEQAATVAIPSGSPVRVLVVLRASATDRTVVLTVKAGSSAQANPSLDRDIDGVYEIAVASVLVRSGASGIAASDIEDTRLDEELCGSAKSRYSYDDVEAAEAASKQAVTVSTNAVAVATQASSDAAQAKRRAGLAQADASDAVETANSVRADADAGKFKGEKGDGVPSGGTAGQVLTKTATGTEWQAAGAVPIGTVLAYCVGTVPTGWLLCDGSTVSTSQYSKLYAVVGARFGATGTVTSFRVPDLRNAFVMGSNGTIGATGGASSATLERANLPSAYASFAVNSISNTEGQVRPLQGCTAQIGQTSGGGNKTMTGSGSYPFQQVVALSGDGEPVNTLPPYVTLAYIIYAGE